MTRTKLSGVWGDNCQWVERCNEYAVCRNLPASFLQTAYSLHNFHPLTVVTSNTRKLCTCHHSSRHSCLYLIRMFSAIYSHSTDYSSYFAIFHWLNRPYFPRPRKYQRLFCEPTHWLRHSRGQYGEGNNQAGIFKAEGNKSLIPGRLARSPLTCLSTRKVRDKSAVALCSEHCSVNTGSPWLSSPKWFDRLFSTCNRQLADRHKPKILERMVFSSSPFLSGVFVTFLFSNWRIRKILCLPDEWRNTGYYKPLLECMWSNGSWALLTRGSGITVNNLLLNGE